MTDSRPLQHVDAYVTAAVNHAFSARTNTRRLFVEHPELFTPKEFLRAAYHEAAHAGVALTCARACDLRLYVETVHIIPFTDARGSCGGFVRLATEADADSGKIGIVASICAAAGLVELPVTRPPMFDYESLLKYVLNVPAPVRDGESAVTDRERIAEINQGGGGSGDPYAEAMAKHVLRAPYVWAGVERIAASLLRCALLGRSAVEAAFWG